MSTCPPFSDASQTGNLANVQLSDLSTENSFMCQASDLQSKETCTQKVKETFTFGIRTVRLPS